MPKNAVHASVGRATSGSYAEVKQVEGEEVYGVDGEYNALEPAQQVTLKMESGKFVRFQPDTGAQCNVLPVHIYCLATEDEDLHNVVEVQLALLAHGGSRVDVVGEAILRVWRGEKSCRIRCKLVDNESIRPISGRRACVGLNITQCTDNDELNRPPEKDDG